MIAHVAIRKTRAGAGWLHAHGWVLGARVGAGLAESRADAIRKACIEAESAGASGIALPHPRDWSAWYSKNSRTHHDPAAVAVALRAASVELMRECIRRRGLPDLGGDARAVVDRIGGPETVAAVLGCDPAQVVRWSRAGRLPEARIQALRDACDAPAAR